MWAGLLDCGVAGAADSRDQLYGQAVALSPLLVRKVQA